MKRVVILILSLLFISQSGYSLEPMKVAFIYTAGGAISVQVKLAANGSDFFTGEQLTNVSANGSGVVIIDVQDYAGSANEWANFASANVTTNHTLDIYVNGTLFSQQRLDQLIKMQSSSSVFDNDGDFRPPTSNSSLGSDDNRWEDAYIGSNTLHVGPDGGMTGGTEMALSYNAGVGQIAVDGANALSATATGVTIPSSLTMTALSGVGNRNIGVDTDGNVVINTNPNITAGDGLTIDVNNDLDVGGSATIIANANNLEVNSSATANQVMVSSGTVGTAATYGAVPLGNSSSVSGTLSVANGGTGAATLATGNFLQGNGTGAVTATKAVPTGAVIGTTDTQTLTNKSIDSDNNTITNIVNADIKSSAAIDATKLVDGSVTNAELQFINTVTSNVQTQLDGKQPNLPDTTGKTGQYLKTEDGLLKWSAVVGGSGGGAFTSASGVTKANTNTDDFLFGTNTLDYNGSGSETKFYFDKSKGAFRAGAIESNAWDDGANVGNSSTAMGNNTTAKSFAETVVGSFNTDYNPNDATDFDADDRAFVVGNGSSNNAKSDAMIVYKNGNTDLNGDLKVQDEVTLSNLAGSGTRNIGVNSDGKIIEVAGGGGGNNLPEVTKLEYTGSDILINTTTYVDIPNITIALEANSTYLIKGILGAVRLGTSSSIYINLDYTGTTDLCMISISGENCSITNESGIYALIGQVNKHSVDATFKTTTAGTLQLQVKKYTPGSTNTNITGDTRFVLIKVQ